MPPQVNAEIAEIERVAAHWRGAEEERLGGWLLRAAEGFTRRANSALPLGDPGLQVETKNSAARALYERCGFASSHRYDYRLAPS